MFLPNNLVLPKEAGTYALLLKLAACQMIQIGRLGELNVQPGYYLYVGSAFGPGGLAARVGRHLRKEKKLRWHIDYLRIACEVAEVWWTCDPVRRECEWASKLRELPGAVIPMPGFGSSDCECVAHLVWVKEKVDLNRILEAKVNGNEKTMDVFTQEANKASSTSSDEKYGANAS